MAETWFSHRAFDDDITLIWENFAAPWMRCNIWHVRGRDRDLVIDTGMGVKPLKAEVARLSDRPLTAISTHAHFDHMGGAHEFDTRLGHRCEADIHADPTAENSVYDGYLVAEAFERLSEDEFDISTYSVTPAPLTGYLDDGDVVDLGNRVFQVLHLPGHSPGSIALYEEKTGTLFSGDTLYQDDYLLDNLYHSDKERFRESLLRMKELPVTAVHGGHFESFGRDRMVELIDKYVSGAMVAAEPKEWIDRIVEETGAGRA
ncbi:MAG: MBL fold metallo-hydrolase [Alphaproteobacteria bacterium]